MFCFFFLWKSSANTYNDLYYNDFCCSSYVIYSSKLNKHILLVMLTKKIICYLRRSFRHVRCTTKIIPQKIDESKVNLDKRYIFTRQIHAKLYHQNTTKNHNQDILSRIMYLRNLRSLLLTLKNTFFNWQWSIDLDLSQAMCHSCHKPQTMSQSFTISFPWKYK